MSQHTQGPWHTNGETIFDSDSNIITYVRTGHPPKEIDEANAYLMAAAPELLAALQSVADYWAGGDVPEDIDAAMRSAIAKATGVQS
jgi:hypothetical protein